MSNALRRTFVLLAAGSAAMAALLAYLPAAGHDQLWLLYVARRILSGDHLYGPTLLESNPPLIVWLSLIPAALARLTHLPSAALGKALVLLAEGVIALLSLRTLRRMHPPPTRVAVAWLAFAFVTVFNVVPARDLGQRDHLLALLCLPYLLAAAARAANLRLPVAEAAVIGLLASVGFALKPHQALVPLAIEATLIVRLRGPRSLLRAESLILTTSAVAYLLAIRSLTPAYFGAVLPLLRQTYWAIGDLTLPQLILEAFQLHILAVLTFALLLFLRRTQPPSAPRTLSPAPSFLFLAGLAATLAYYLQGTGWYYQQLPAITFFSFAAALAVVPLLDRLAAPRWLPPAAAGLGLIAILLTAWAMDWPFTAARSFPIDTPDPAFFRGLSPGTPVATLTTTVDYTVMPAARFGLTVAQRYPHLWMLPAILRSESPAPNPAHPLQHPIPTAQLLALDRLQHRFMVEDLARWQPPLVLVERCQDPAVHCQVLEDRHDNLLAWFLRDPAFAALWVRYQFAGSRGSFDAYTLRPVKSPATRMSPN